MANPISAKPYILPKVSILLAPILFAPEARRTTAKLHVLALKQAGRRDFWRFVRGVMRGRPLEDRANLIPLNCTTLDILCDEPWPIQADGDADNNAARAH